MKKILAIILISVLTISLFGCQSREEKLIEETKEQAEEYYNNGDLDNSIKLYEKILELKEDTENRKYLDELLAEKETLDVVKAFMEAIDEFRYKIDTIHNMPELSEFMMGIKNNFDELEQVDTTKDTEIAIFAKDLLSDENYIQIKNRYDEDYIKNAQYNADLSKTLDKALGGVESTVADKFVFDSVKNNTENALKNIPDTLPSKYNN